MFEQLVAQKCIFHGLLIIQHRMFLFMSLYYGRVVRNDWQCLNVLVFTAVPIWSPFDDCAPIDFDSRSCTAHQSIVLYCTTVPIVSKLQKGDGAE